MEVPPQCTGASFSCWCRYACRFFFLHPLQRWRRSSRTLLNTLSPFSLGLVYSNRIYHISIYRRLILGIPPLTAVLRLNRGKLFFFFSLFISGANYQVFLPPSCVVAVCLRLCVLCLLVLLLLLLLVLLLCAGAACRRRCRRRCCYCCCSFCRLFCGSCVGFILALWRGVLACFSCFCLPRPIPLPNLPLVINRSLWDKHY